MVHPGILVRCHESENVLSHGWRNRVQANENASQSTELECTCMPSTDTITHHLVAPCGWEFSRSHPKDPSFTKKSAAPESMVFCYSCSFLLPHSCLFFHTILWPCGQGGGWESRPLSRFCFALVSKGCRTLIITRLTHLSGLEQGGWGLSPACGCQIGRDRASPGKSLMSDKKMLVILGPDMAVPILWATGIFWFFM